MPFQDDSDRDRSFPAARVALGTAGLLVALLVVAAIVRPDMMMHALHVMMEATGTAVGH